MSSESFLETIRSVDGEVLHVEYHQQRYESVLKQYANAKIEKLEDILNPPKKGLLKCRVLYSCKNIEVTYSPYKAKKIDSLKLVYDNNIEYKYKSTCRDNINQLYAKKDNNDEIIIVKNGYITDSSIANIALHVEGKWVTPKSPLLRGTTRERLLKNNFLTEKNITVDELRKSKRLALMNAMIGFFELEEFKIKG